MNFPQRRASWSCRFANGVALAVEGGSREGDQSGGERRIGKSHLTGETNKCSKKMLEGEVIQTEFRWPKSWHMVGKVCLQKKHRQGPRTPTPNILDGRRFFKFPAWGWWLTCPPGSLGTISKLPLDALEKKIGHYHLNGWLVVRQLVVSQLF